MRLAVYSVVWTVCLIDLPCDADDDDGEVLLMTCDIHCDYTCVRCMSAYLCVLVCVTC